MAAERQRLYDGGCKTDILQIRELCKASPSRLRRRHGFRQLSFVSYEDVSLCCPVLFADLCGQEEGGCRPDLRGRPSWGGEVKYISGSPFSPTRGSSA